MTDDFVPVEHLPHYRELKTVLPYAESELRTKIYEAIGAASTCWGNLNGAGIFDSERASRIGQDLIDEVIELTSMGDPALGCATTEELLDELKTRIATGAVGLSYRTIDKQ